MIFWAVGASQANSSPHISHSIVETAGAAAAVVGGGIAACGLLPNAASRGWLKISDITSSERQTTVLSGWNSADAHFVSLSFPSYCGAGQ